MSSMQRRVTLAAAVLVIATVSVAVPVLGGVDPVASTPGAGSPAAEDPAATPAPAATEKPGKGPKTEHPGRGHLNGAAGPPGRADKPARPLEAPVEATGRVGTRTTDAGDTEFTLTTGGTVLVLEAGPPWFWGEDHPLASYAGKTVTVAGHRAEGSDTIDVDAVDGNPLREPGRPPWAGGPNAVGEIHPGWKAWKADRGSGRPGWAGPRAPDEDDQTP